MRQIERENKILLKKILAQRPDVKKTSNPNNEVCFFFLRSIILNLLKNNNVFSVNFRQTQVDRHVYPAQL